MRLLSSLSQPELTCRPTPTARPKMPYDDDKKDGDARLTYSSILSSPTSRSSTATTARPIHGMYPLPPPPPNDQVAHPMPAFGSLPKYSATSSASTTGSYRKSSSSSKSTHTSTYKWGSSISGSSSSSFQSSPPRAPSSYYSSSYGSGRSCSSYTPLSPTLQSS